MRPSRFNWVSRHASEGRRLVLNPLSGTADLLDAGDERLLLEGEGADSLDAGDAEDMLARGYFHPSPTQEDDLLERLWSHEQERSAAVVGLHLGVNRSGRAPDLAALTRAIEERLATRPGAPLGVVVLARSIAPPPPSPDDLAALARRCRALGAGLTVVVAPASLPLFAAVLAERLPNSVVLSTRLEPGEDAAAFACRLEAPLDELVYRRWPVVLELDVRAETLPLLPALANEMIRRGWPIQENFHCRLVPAEGAGCDFGLVYPADVALARGVLAAFAAHPQTQFLSLERWIGLRAIHALIWHGRLPPPSPHFCAASQGLGVLAADGGLHPCPRLAEAGVDEPPPQFPRPQREWVAPCSGCRFLPACGGGCRLAAREGAPACPPVDDLLAAAAEAWLPELLAKAAYVERQEARAP